MKKFKERKKADETKTRETLRKAAYQYCLDHTYPTPKGMLVNFYLPEENEFYRKLEAREYLDYIRVKKDEQFQEYHRWLVEYNKMKRAINWTRIIEKKNRLLYQNGDFITRRMMDAKRWLAKRINKKLKEIEI